MSKLDGRRVLITGGAQGIGLEMALKFAGRGSEIVLADLDQEGLVGAKAKVAELGVPVWGFHVDVTNPASIAALKAQVDAEVGPIDVLVNNAGVVFGGPFTKTSLDDHFKTYEVNILGVVAMTHAFMDDLIGRPEAHIVTIASASGFVGLPYGSSYASSKWAAIGFSESIRAELKVDGHDHVHVTIVCPSYIGTGMFEGAEAPKATHILEPDFVAEKVVQAVEHNSIYVKEPWIIKVTPLLRELLPTGLYDQISHLLGADTSMAHWTGRHGDAKAEPEEQAPSDDQPEAER